MLRSFFYFRFPVIMVMTAMTRKNVPADACCKGVTVIMFSACRPATVNAWSAVPRNKYVRLFMIFSFLE